MAGFLEQLPGFRELRHQLGDFSNYLSNGLKNGGHNEARFATGVLPLS
jgi:hypothetical protein